MELREFNIVGVTSDEYINVELPCFVIETFLVAPWNYLVTMQQAHLGTFNVDYLRSHRYYLLLRIFKRVILEVTTNYVHLRSECLNPILDLPTA
jgi:hypothetical protein